MNETANVKLLQVTRVLIYVMLAGLALGATALIAASVFLPFHWSEALAEIAKENPGADTSTLQPKLYTVFALAILLIGLVWTILRKLLAIIVSVATGDPFVLANAARLKAIGWLMVAVQLVGVPLAFAAGALVDLFGDDNIDPDFSINGILAILLVFILAGIFERGAQMREELEGTV